MQQDKESRGMKELPIAAPMDHKKHYVYYSNDDSTMWGVGGGGGEVDSMVLSKGSIIITESMAGYDTHNHILNARFTYPTPLTH